MVLFSIIMNSDDAFAASFVTPLSISLSESLAYNLNTLKTCFLLRTVKNRLLKYHLKYANAELIYLLIITALLFVAIELEYTKNKMISAFLGKLD